VDGTISNLSGSGTSYTATFTGSANIDASNASVSVTGGSWSENNGNPGAAGSTGSFTVDTVTPVIMAPITATVGQSQGTTIGSVSLSEAGNLSGETFTATLTDTNGLLSANTSATGGGGTINGSGGTSLTITGTLTQVNADLTTLSDKDATSGSDTITLNATDSFGNSATQKQIAVTAESVVPTVTWSGVPTGSIKRNKPTSIGTLTISANSIPGDTNTITSETVSGSGGTALAGTILFDDKTPTPDSVTADGSGNIAATSVATWNLGSGNPLTLHPLNSPGTFTLTASATETNVTGDTLTNSATLTVTVTDPAGIAGHAINLALADLSADQGDMVTVTVAGLPTDWSLNSGTNNGDGSWTVQTSDPASLTVTTPSSFAGAMVLNVTESWTNVDDSTGAAIVADNVEAYPASPIFAVSGDDTLTGAGGNDQFVFAQPIGNDTVYNFNAASDTVDLIGFGIGDYSALQANIANDGNSNAVVTLASGETITLMGVDPGALSAANFVFDEEPTSHNAGTMTVGDGAILRSAAPSTTPAPSRSTRAATGPSSKSWCAARRSRAAGRSCFPTIARTSSPPPTRARC
jgi:hypothetical protein